MANLAINTTLEKMTGKDKDCRYMATSDLLNELSKEGFKADNDLEHKISSTVLQQLDDASGDVSGLAVKCLAPLVKKVSETCVLEMTDKLCDKLLNEKDQHRDIASIAMKAIVSEVTSTTVTQRVLGSISPQLIKGITGPGMSSEITCECLDILCGVLNEFGSLMMADHGSLLGALLSQLSSNQASVRKRSISCIASLASKLSDDLLAKATVEVVQLLKNKGQKSEMTRANIQMIGALSRSVGYRFGPHLGDTVPLLINYCTSASENDEELREHSLQALESFVLNCPRDISAYCDQILKLTLEFLCYDPNFTENMEEDTDDESHEKEEEDESANEYTDDEDISLKVRRASAKCLAAIIVSRPEMLSELYGEACPKLIERFKEREENLKMDVFNTFIELLRQTGNVTNQIETNHPQWLLMQEVPKIIESINKQLREKSMKTKVGAFSVLKELVVVLPDCLTDLVVGGTPVSDIEKVFNLPILCPMTHSIIQEAPHLINGHWQSRYISEFKELEYIGSGSYGHICKAKNNLDGNDYAIKKILLNIMLSDVHKGEPEPFQFAKREVITMSMMDHPSVIRYYQAWIEHQLVNTDFTKEDQHLLLDMEDDEKTRTSPCLYIQLQLCKRTLAEFLSDERTTHAARIRVWSKIIEGLFHVHSKDVVHCDLHRSNILMDGEDNPIIADFGLARGIGERHIPLKPNNQPRFWPAPEVLAGSEEITFAADIYSLAFICYELFKFRRMMGQERAVDFENLKQGIIPEDWLTALDRSFLTGMILQDPLARPSLSECLQVFSAVNPPM